MSNETCALGAAQIPLDSSRLVSTQHDSTRSTCWANREERVERVEPCSSNMADDEQALVLACTSEVVFMLLHTQILFVT